MKCFDSKELKVWSNERNRTFTIKKYDESGKCYAKYRTIPQNNEEFRYYHYATERDWRQFFKTDEYYVVR